MVVMVLLLSDVAKLQEVNLKDQVDCNFLCLFNLAREQLDKIKVTRLTRDENCQGPRHYVSPQFVLLYM